MKNRDTLKTLHQNEYGAIRKCSCCDEIQIIFGTYFCSLPEETFMQFAKYLDAQQLNMADQMESMPACQRMLINTGTEKHMLAVRKKELTGLVEVVTMAAILLEAENLLQTF